MASPLIISGKIYQSDGSTPRENALVYVFNKNTNETHNGNESNFPELKTNASGEYLVNLANYDLDWSVDDRIYVSAYFDDSAQSDTFTLTGDPVPNKNLTLRVLELAVSLIRLLTMKVADPNTSRSNKLFNFKFPTKELTKDDYPIVTIKDVAEEGVPVGIANTNNGMEINNSMEIKVFVWSKDANRQKFIINSVSYEGTKLRDYLSRLILEALRKEFYQTPKYNVNAVVNRFFDYKPISVESLDFDEVEDGGIMQKEIEIELKSIRQEA